MAKQFTLGKNERLKSLKAIEQLFKEGHRFTVSPFRVNYTKTPGGLKFGVGVSTKNFKKAVDRNLIKRLTREAFRLQKKILKDKLNESGKGFNVFFIYTSKELPGYEQVLEKVNLILSKLLKIADEKNSSDT